MDRLETLRAVTAGRPPRLAWLRQIHSGHVRSARVGFSGEGDALVTGESNLALCVATADCLPIAIEGSEQIACLHAGWRGLVAGLIPATVESLSAAPGEARAWIGPAIGPCCYEVGSDVASQVAAATGNDDMVHPGRERPHLDLARAARLQLLGHGIQDVTILQVCTRCESQRLWSYRRLGPRAGRNWAFVWLRGKATG
jgi:YfiH family protein